MLVVRQLGKRGPLALEHFARVLPQNLAAERPSGISATRPASWRTRAHRLWATGVDPHAGVVV